MEDRRTISNQPAAAGTSRASRIDLSRQHLPKGNQAEQASFRQAFEAQLHQISDVAFSKHAVSRAIERNLDLSGDQIARLNEGVKLAAEKKLEDPLILVGGTAFLVNIRHHKVITAVDAEELKGNVFTNIDGTVII